MTGSLGAMGRWPGWIRLSQAESCHLQFLSFVRIIFARSLLAPEIAGGEIYHYSLSSLAVACCVYHLPSTFRVLRVRLPGSRGRTLLATRFAYIRRVYAASLLVWFLGCGL